MTTVYFLVSWSLYGKVELEDLRENLSSRVHLVSEFAKIKEISKELGLKEVYLFGGTASAWAHYVYADLEREDGTSKFYKEHFDYDFTSIFRSNQDMDIAIDGTPEQAALLEEKMAKLFPFFQGKKSVFEVRLLNSSRGDKDAIIGNSDFINQNNDSHSTGLIEIVGDGKNRVLDVKDLKNKTPQFLRDVYEKKLHFYYDHDLHRTTKRFKEGKNPEIIAVVRYLTKVFQYELEIDSESERIISKIISQFKIDDVEKSDAYVKYWLEKNGPKLFQNAINVEYAWNTLERLGLRHKFVTLNNAQKTNGSFAWWMNKVPLRTKSLGKGSGKSAKELGLDIVAHETNTFSAYESITKAHSGDPNVFISREEAVGEFAAHGDGFYVRVGKKGARNTGITIRFHLHPDARLNTDFSISDDYIVVHNKSALKVIPESISLNLYEYLYKISKKELIFDESDLGVLEKVRRKLQNSSRILSQIERQKILKLIKDSMSDLKSNTSLFGEWFALELSSENPEIVSELYKKLEECNDEALTRKVYSMLIKAFKDNQKWQPSFDLIHPILISKNQSYELLSVLFKEKSWKSFDPLIDFVIKDKIYWKAIVTSLLCDPTYKRRDELIGIIAKEESYWGLLIEHVLPYGKVKQFEEIIQNSLNSGKYNQLIMRHVLNSPVSKNHPEWVRLLMEDSGNLRPLIHWVLSQDHWSAHLDLYDELISKSGAYMEEIIDSVYSTETMLTYRSQEIIDFIKSDTWGRYDKFIIESVLSKKSSLLHPEIFELLFKRSKENRERLRGFLGLKHYLQNPEIKRRVYSFIVTAYLKSEEGFWALFNSPASDEEAELLYEFLKEEKLRPLVRRLLEGEPERLNHPIYQKMFDGSEKISVQMLINHSSPKGNCLSMFSRWLK